MHFKHFIYPTSSEHLKSPVNQTNISLDCGRSQKNPEERHTGMRRASKLHTWRKYTVVCKSLKSPITALLIPKMKIWQFQHGVQCFLKKRKLHNWRTKEEVVGLKSIYSRWEESDILKKYEGKKIQQRSDMGPQRSWPFNLSIYCPLKPHQKCSRSHS